MLLQWPWWGPGQAPAGAIPVRVYAESRVFAMKYLSLQARFWLCCGSLLAIVLAIGAVGFWSAQKTRTLVHTVQFNNQKQGLSAAIELAVEKEKVGGRDALLHSDASYLTAAREDFRAQSSTLQPLLSTPTSHQLFASIQDSNAAYGALVDQSIEAHSAGDQEKALAIFYGQDAQKARADLKQSTAGLVDWYSKLASDAESEQAVLANQTTILILVLGLVGLIVGTVVAVVGIRSLIAGIAPIVSTMQQISNHNLCIPDVEVFTKDELGNAGNALNAMKGNLTRMVGSITRFAEQLAQATEEIAASAKENSTSAHGEAQEAVQVASAMQEMSASVREVADFAQNASQSSEKSALAARQGGEVAGQTLSMMDKIATTTNHAAARILELGKSSERIGSIIAVISEIADQTNLLALNAAIEAARAGEQGRGFAVVAGEVRRLAERTGAATGEISQMIQQIQNGIKTAIEAIEEGKRQVEQGVAKTNETGDALQSIIRMSEELGQMVSHIAGAATQQRTTSDEISSNISRISDLTQRSSAHADQTTEASSQLSVLASDLHRLVGEFCVADETRASQAGPQETWRQGKRPPVVHRQAA